MVFLLLRQNRVWSCRQNPLHWSEGTNTNTNTNTNACQAKSSLVLSAKSIALEWWHNATHLDCQAFPNFSKYNKRYKYKLKFNWGCKYKSNAKSSGVSEGTMPHTLISKPGLPNFLQIWLKITNTKFNWKYKYNANTSSIKNANKSSMENNNSNEMQI